MARRLLSFLTTSLCLLLTGAVAGSILAVLGLALNSALKSLQSSDSEGVLGFLAELFVLLLNVLAVSIAAAPDGIWAGVIIAAAVSLSYGVVLWFFPQLQAHRWTLGLIFAAVGVLAVAFSLHSLLAAYGLTAAVAAALFGLVAGLALGKKQLNPM